jgi:hypothetical protein
MHPAETKITFSEEHRKILSSFRTKGSSDEENGYFCPLFLSIIFEFQLQPLPLP